MRSTFSPSRLSPIPPTSGSVFPTVLEEPTTPTEDTAAAAASSAAAAAAAAAAVGPAGLHLLDQQTHTASYNSSSSVLEQQQRKQPLRRRLALSTAAAGGNVSSSRSSLSFDSGISCLLSERGSPSPPLSLGVEHTGAIDPPYTVHQDAATASAYLSPSASPGPTPRSPLRSVSSSYQTAFQRSPLSTAVTNAGQPPPPISPTYKHQRLLAAARRFSSDNPVVDSTTTTSYSSPSRTLSPIPKSPSPSSSQSTKSSPMQLPSSTSSSSSVVLHESDTSPPNISTPSSPAAGGGGNGGPSSPVYRSRRMLPETPMPRYVSSRIKQVYTPLSAERTMAWQSLSSHDSLDSGVYSRSTASSDSTNTALHRHHARNLSSPNSATQRVTSGDYSPPPLSLSLARRCGWRRSLGARLPEATPPFAASPTAFLEDWETTASSDLRRKSFPNHDWEEHRRQEDGEVNEDDEIAIPVSSATERCYLRHSTRLVHGDSAAAVPSATLSSISFRHRSHLQPHNHPHRVHFDPTAIDEDQYPSFSDCPFRPRHGYNYSSHSSSTTSPLSSRHHLPLRSALSAHHYHYEDGGAGASAPEEAGANAVGISHPHYEASAATAVSSLEVPKLRDLKSHSFPPSWTRDSLEEDSESDSKSGESAAEKEGENEEEESSDKILAPPQCYKHAAIDRRRRWLLYAQTFSADAGYVELNMSSYRLLLGFWVLQVVTHVLRTYHNPCLFARSITGTQACECTCVGRGPNRSLIATQSWFRLLDWIRS